MVRSLYSGVSGLKVHQTRMDVIGNNIANVNTAGFKASRVSFADIYYQAARTESGGNATFAGNNSAQVGYGAQIAAIDKDMSGGNLQSSNRLLDLAIAGEGFFCVGSLDENGNVNGVNYTRMGNFGIDSAGNLVNALNQFVLGRNNVSRIKGGTYSSTQLDGQLPAEKANEMEAINIFERIWDAFKPEAEMDIDNVTRKYWKDEAANYYSFSTEGITVPEGSGVTQVAPPTITDGVRTGGRKLMTIFEGTDPYDDTRSIAYDYHMQDTAAAATGTATVPADYSVNVVHTAANRYIKQYGNQAAANVNEAGYKANVYSTDGRLLTEYDNSAAAAKATMRNNQYQVATDYILYTKDGKYMNNQGVQYDEDVGLYKDEEGNYYEYECITTIGDDGTLTKTHTYTKMNEIVDQDGNKQYYRSTNAYDVYDYDPVDRVFASREPDPNGNILYANMTDISLKYSDMQSFNITETGVITAKYGGVLKYLARIDLATFENVDGLNEVGQTQFEETAASGVPNIKKAQSSGAGAIKASRLEMSNVSLADEFSDMIVTQRGFQANARIITTSDSMLEELVNMKR
ncbi:MAG: flagellar hook-basal body complex protein [Oscillospiraceae bacterium]|nr:flagellar hook-basal body complex protein [Oscillospiraceae bacterium]